LVAPTTVNTEQQSGFSAEEKEKQKDNRTHFTIDASGRFPPETVHVSLA
jgi:hypothetical protein